MTMSKEQPIGIFDSGLGGLSICREVVSLLPNESIMYLADSLNAPYGQKTKEQIVNLSVKNTEYLLDKGCKLIVVACNTATTNAISHLRTNYAVPFIGIEPAIKPAALHSSTNRIGILATRGTLNSELFAKTSEPYRSEIEIIEVEGKGLVPLIEQGKIAETENLLRIYLAEMIEKGVDKIVLGCSHYPFLTPLIKQLVPPHVDIIDSGEAVAKQTKAMLEQNAITTINPESVVRRFYTNADQSILKAFLERMEMPFDTADYLNF